MKLGLAKRIAAVIFGCVFFLLSLLLVLPRVIDLDEYRQPLVKQLQAVTGGEVSLEGIRWGMTRGLWVELKTLSITNASIAPMDFTASHVYVKIAVLALIKGKLEIKSISIDEPRLSYRLQEEVPSEAGVTEPEALESSGLPLGLAVGELSIRGGYLSVQDSLTIPGETQHIQLENVDLTIENLAPGKEITYALSLTAQTEQASTPAKLSVKGSFEGLGPALTLHNPKLVLDARLEALEIGQLSAYLKNTDMASRLGGSVSATLQYRGDLGASGSVSGDVDLSNFAYSDPSLWAHPVPGVPTTLHYEIDLAPSALTVKQLSLKLGEIVLQGRATLQDWQAEPVLADIAFTGHMPLDAAKPVLPHQLLAYQSALVDDLLSGGGEIILESLTIADIELSQLDVLMDSPAALLEGSQLSVKIKDVSIKAVEDLPRINKINAHVQLVGSVLKVENIHAVIGPLTVPPIQVEVSDLLEQPKVAASVKGQLILADKPDKDLEKMLGQLGLAKVVADGYVDIKASYETAKPEQWQAEGNVVINSLRVETENASVVAALSGRIDINKQQHLDIPALQLQGTLNDSPLSVAGHASALAEPNMAVKMQVKLDGLDLSALSGLDKLLTDLSLNSLKGLLTTDLDIEYQHSSPMNTQLNGSLELQGLALDIAAMDMSISKGEADIAFTPGKITVKKLQLTVNEQALLLTGSLRDIAAPQITLNLSSPHLNIERLLPVSKPEDTAATDTASENEKDKPVQLPEFAKNIIVKLAVNIDKGQYQNTSFDHLMLKAKYVKGQLEQVDVKVDVAGGSIKAMGSADLTDFQSIPFVLDHDVKSVNLEEILPLLIGDDGFVSGSLSSDGHLQGRTGESLKQSLRGQLSVTAGPGSIPQESSASAALLKMLAVLDIQGLIQEGVGKNVKKKSMPYRSIVLEADFIEQGMHITQLEVKMAALDAEGKGMVVLAEDTIDMNIVVTVLGALDKTLGFVPLLGDAVADVTKIYVRVSGALDEPRVRVKPVAGVVKGVDTIIKKPGQGIKKGIKVIKDWF